MWVDNFIFLNRSEAGKQLVLRLRDEPVINEVTPDDLLVLSIPRGGVVVGAEVAKGLGCAHDVIVTKKITLPARPEFAIGAIAEDGDAIFNDQLLIEGGIRTNHFDQAVKKARYTVRFYIDKFRQNRPLNVRGKRIILVDDGMATGETVKAAINWLKTRPDPLEKLIVALPVCAPRPALNIKNSVDTLICLATPDPFWAVGQFYWEFDIVSEKQVLEYLAQQSPELSEDPMVVAEGY